MTADLASDWPDPAPARPLWLVTLADLALLMVGFLVLVQAGRVEPRDLARSLRGGFAAAPAAEPPMPVAANRVAGFATGSAAPPAGTADLVGWARAQLADPRVLLTVTGTAGGGTDVDPATGSAALLAVDRARAVAAQIAPAAPARVAVAASLTGGAPAVTVTLAFAGEPVRTMP